MSGFRAPPVAPASLAFQALNSLRVPEREDHPVDEVAHGPVDDEHDGDREKDRSHHGDHQHLDHAARLCTRCVSFSDDGREEEPRDVGLIVTGGS